jgi:hypothetical protein
VFGGGVWGVTRLSGSQFMVEAINRHGVRVLQQLCSDNSKSISECCEATEINRHGMAAPLI